MYVYARSQREKQTGLMDKNKCFATPAAPAAPYSAPAARAASQSIMHHSLYQLSVMLASTHVIDACECFSDCGVEFLLQVKAAMSPKNTLKQIRTMTSTLTALCEVRYRRNGLYLSPNLDI